MRPGGELTNKVIDGALRCPTVDEEGIVNEVVYGSVEELCASSMMVETGTAAGSVVGTSAETVAAVAGVSGSVVTTCGSPRSDSSVDRAGDAAAFGYTTLSLSESVEEADSTRTGVERVPDEEENDQHGDAWCGRRTTSSAMVDISR